MAFRVVNVSLANKTSFTRFDSSINSTNSLAVKCKLRLLIIRHCLSTIQQESNWQIIDTLCWIERNLKKWSILSLLMILDASWSTWWQTSLHMDLKVEGKHFKVIFRMYSYHSNKLHNNLNISYRSTNYYTTIQL